MKLSFKIKNELKAHGIKAKVKSDGGCHSTAIWVTVIDGCVQEARQLVKRFEDQADYIFVQN